MSNIQSLAEFVAKYDVHDRFVERIEWTPEAVLFTFEMFHCDDPQRNDENTSYFLIVAFPSDSVEVTDGEIPDPVNVMGGEVLKLEQKGQKIVMGVYWRLRLNQKTVWTEFSVSSSPLSIEEVVLPI